jgi:hypothetical protein
MSIKEEISEWGKLKEYNEKFFMGICIQNNELELMSMV